METVVHTYLWKREFSLQEPVYQVMPELWLRKIFPGVLYAISDIPEKRVGMILRRKEIFELPKYNAGIHKRNMVNKYMITPNDSIFQHHFYALFIKRHQLQPKPIKNDWQLEVLDDKRFEVNHFTTDSYLDVSILSSGEILHYRKVELLLWYHESNKFKDPEGYVHHLLFMFYPFRNECELR